jgi:hypothetical protein
VSYLQGNNFGTVAAKLNILKPRIAFSNVENVMYCALTVYVFLYDYHSTYQLDLILVVVSEQRPEVICYICCMS